MEQAITLLPSKQNPFAQEKRSRKQIKKYEKKEAFQHQQPQL
jgi:hypothetical protein